MKKFIIIFFYLFIFTSSAFAAENLITFEDNRTLSYNPNTWCTANGSFVDFNSNGVPFFTYTENLPEGSVNYVPVRTIAEAMGLIVSYNENEYTIELKSADRILLMTINSPYSTLYDTSYNPIKNIMLTASASVSTACPIRIINDTSYVPVRAVAESFGFYVGYSDGQIMLAISQEYLKAINKDSVSMPVNIYGMSKEIRISNYTNPDAYSKFVQNNNLTNLVGYLCRTRAEKMWIIGVPESRLEYYDTVIAPQYFDCIYYKPTAEAPWTEFNEDVAMSQIHDVSTSMTTVIVNEGTNFVFSALSELEGTQYYNVFSCLNQYSGTVPKAVVDAYPSSYNLISNGQSTEAVLYKISLPYSNKTCYILNYGNNCEYLPSELFSGVNFTQDTMITIPNKGILYVFCDIIIVDIEDIK